MPNPKKTGRGRRRETETSARREIGPATQRAEATRIAEKKELFDLHDKARELFEQGKYRESFDTYVEYGDQMGKTKGLAGVEAAILEAARKFEGLNYWYEAGNLYLIAANYLNNVGVTSDAGDFFLAAAETLDKAQDRSLKGLIASCYGAASQTLRVAKKLSESDKVLMKGVLAATGKNPLEVEGIAFKTYRTNNFQGASDLFNEAAAIYVKAIDELSDLASSVQEGPLAVDVKSTLHHRAAQNFLASAACAWKSGNKQDATKVATAKAADQFTRAIINYTPLFSLGEAHKVDYRRYGYDLMMGTALRTTLGSTEDIGILQDQLLAIDKERTKKLGESGYLVVALALMKTKKIRSVITDLQDINLGSIDEIKDTIIELLMKSETEKKK